MTKTGEGNHEDIEQGRSNNADHSSSDEENEDDSRESSIAETSVDEFDDLENSSEVKLGIVGRAERNCRICHLGMQGKDEIILGCCCKGDLGSAHRQCAETWFKIKGNKICEICGSTAQNIIVCVETEALEQEIAVNDSAASVTRPAERRRFWQGHRFLNFLLGCLVFAFVFSWLFHFNIPG